MPRGVRNPKPEDVVADTSVKEPINDTDTVIETESKELGDSVPGDIIDDTESIKPDTVKPETNKSKIEKSKSDAPEVNDPQSEADETKIDEPKIEPEVEPKIEPEVEPKIEPEVEAKADTNTDDEPESEPILESESVTDIELSEYTSGAELTSKLPSVRVFDSSISQNYRRMKYPLFVKDSFIQYDRIKVAKSIDGDNIGWVNVKDVKLVQVEEV